MTPEITAAQWIPHERSTWPWRVGRLKKETELQTWHGHGAEPEFTYRTLPVGTKIKIVMVSRLGDVGITDDPSAETGYGARVSLEDLEQCDD